MSVYLLEIVYVESASIRSAFNHSTGYRHHVAVILDRDSEYSPVVAEMLEEVCFRLRSAHLSFASDMAGTSRFSWCWGTCLCLMALCQEYFHVLAIQHFLRLPLLILKSSSIERIRKSICAAVALARTTPEYSNALSKISNR